MEQLCINGFNARIAGEILGVGVGKLRVDPVPREEKRFAAMSRLSQRISILPVKVSLRRQVAIALLSSRAL